MKFVGYTEETKEQDRKEWIDKISVNYKNHFVKAYSGKARTSAVKVFFDKRWWLANRDKFHNGLILGEPFCDYYYKEMAFKHTKKVLVQRALYHIYHETKWNLISPGSENNKKIHDGIK